MKNSLIRVTTALAAIAILTAAFAVGGTGTMAQAQQNATQNATQNQPTSMIEMVCASAANSTSTASTANGINQYAGNETMTSLASNSSATSDLNATMSAEEPNDLLRSILTAKAYLQNACQALQNDDTPGALGYLVVVEKEIYKIEGNLTSTDAAGNASSTDMAGTTQGQNQTGANDLLGGLRDLFGGG